MVENKTTKLPSNSKKTAPVNNGTAFCLDTNLSVSLYRNGVKFLSLGQL